MIRPIDGLMGSSHEDRRIFHAELQYMASFNYYGELLLANRYDKSAWAGDMGNMAVKWTCHGPV